MKKVFLFLIVSGLIVQTYSQSSIIIGNGAELNIGSGADVCASEHGNIAGNITGSGTQCLGALPVLISSFTAAVENNRDIKMFWTTTMEINNKGFEIERKQNADEWINAGWVAGSGNSNVPVNYFFSDNKLNAGKYSYRLKQIDYNGNFEYHALSNDVLISQPNEFSLSQSYPNPSNPVSKIDFQLPFAGNVTIKVFDITGREVAKLIDENKEAGFYSVTFDGNNLASGVYFYRIQAEGEGQNFTAVKKLLLVK